jgi:hypothetical protein
LASTTFARIHASTSRVDTKTGEDPGSSELTAPRRPGRRLCGSGRNGERHGDILDKFSVISPHHESCPSHTPDQSWESAATDLVMQMCTTQYGGNCVGNGHHSAWWDWYYRDAPFFFRDQFQNGGLHDNAY